MGGKKDWACHRCGAEYDTDDKFCVICGKGTTKIRGMVDKDKKI